MKKINKSSSFCMCFNPVVMESGLVFEAEEPSKPVKAVLSSPALDVVTSNVKDTDVVGSLPWKNKLGRQSFSRYIKAVLFETSLMKKMRDQKSERKLRKTLNRGRAKSKKKIKIEQSTDDSQDESKDDSNDILSVLNDKSSSHEEDNYSTSDCSTLSSSGFDSTSGATLSTNSEPSSKTTSRCSSISLSLTPRSSSISSQSDRGISEFDKGCCYSSYVGLLLFLISLFALVLWGKICAILCTSTYLVFTFRRNLKLSSSENNAAESDHPFPGIDTEKYYKKKVIMEGLLERNQYPRSCYKPYRNS